MDILKKLQAKMNEQELRIWYWQSCYQAEKERAEALLLYVQDKLNPPKPPGEDNGLRNA